MKSDVVPSQIIGHDQNDVFDLNDLGLVAGDIATNYLLIFKEGGGFTFLDAAEHILLRGRVRKSIGRFGTPF